MSESVKGLLAAYTVQSSPTYNPNMVKRIWTREFHSRFFKVEHHRPEQFVRSEWQSKPQVNIIYLSYRWLLATIFLATLILSIFFAGVNDDFGVRYAKWIIYLTNWGYTACTLQALLAAALLTHQRIVEKKKVDLSSDPRKTPISYKVYWVFHTIATVVSVGITAAYWSFVYDPASHTLNALNLLLHAFNSVFMLTDFLLVSHPFRLLHCYWPFLFTIAYVLFSFIYYEFGGTDRHDRPYIYPILDWRMPRRTTLISVGGLIFTVFVHFSIWLLFLLRQKLSKYLMKKNEQQEQTDGAVPSPTQTSIPMDSIVV